MYLEKQQILRIQWLYTTSRGVVETAPAQSYLIESFNVPAGSKDVEMKLTSRLAMLDREFTFGTYTGSSRTIKSLAEYVLSNSGVLREYNGQEPWVLPDSLESFSTNAPIPDKPANVLLQMLALASCTWLTTRSTDGYVEFLESQPTSEFCAVGLAQELGDPKITIHNQVRSLSVGVYHYTAGTGPQALGSVQYVLTGTNVLTIKYNVPYAINVSATISGASIQSARYYNSYAVLTVEAGTDAAVQVELSGTPVEETVSYVELYRDQTITDGRDITVENPFITSVEHAARVAQYVLQYYSRRQTYSVPYIGYPQLEAGDSIVLETIYGAGDVSVLENTIKFNGGWSGTLGVL